ncbi:S8 family serine peptidase [bacterium]|nr:S8 family serine peptidase [bacterium]
MKRLMWLLPALVLMLGVTQVQAGDISPELEERWSKLASSERVNAIFHLWERVDLREMDIAIRNMKATRQLRHQIVVEELQRVARETQPPLLADLEELKLAGKIDGYTAYWIVNCVVVKGELATLQELAKHGSIQWVEPIPVIELIEPVRHSDRAPRRPLDDRTPGVNSIRAPEVWYELGYTGEGTLVANMDTGVDGNHVALGSRWRGTHAPHEECWLDVLNGGTNFPTDNNSHGTHVMGTICGTGSATSTFDTVGVAPAAEWIAMNAIGGFGGDFDSDVLQGYQWFADPDGDPSTIEDVPDVIQNSWGVYSGLGYPDCFTDWNEAIIACETAGTVVTFSAGNEGPQQASHRSPANIALDSVTFFSVGATIATDLTPPYELASFSSRGPSDCDGVTIKPEVIAPGENVYSSFPGNQFGELSGTSMAGPHVAGIVALMREANPNADVREIKGVLMQTAIDYAPTGDDNNNGRGFVDAYEAVLLISADRGWVVGQVTSGATGAPISGARVQAGDNYVRFSDSQGNYRISLPADSTLPFVVSAFGFAEYSTTMSVADSDTVVVNIELTPVAAGILEGTVLIGNDIPVQGARVEPVGIPVGPVNTDEDGQFSYTLPGSNTYSFEVTFQDMQVDTSFPVTTDETNQVLVRFNTRRSQNVGPDSYGYRAFDRYDNGLPPTYNWADMTGGTVHDFPDIFDASVFVEMPFTFVYYGQRFDSITINENGWVAAGEDPDRRNANTIIPHPAGPSGMLALFWDQLEFGTAPVPSQVMTKYDPANGVFIIEYENMYFPPATENNRISGQIHIFDQEVWPTPTGDCEIMYVYGNIDVVNSGTVGIESPSELAGLRILYNTTLNDSAFAIEAGATILFSTRTSARTTGNMSGTITAHPVLGAAVPNGVRLGNVMAQVAANGNYSFTNVFAGPRTLRVQIPGYEQIAVAGTIQTGQTTDLDAEVYRLDPPQNLTFTRTNDSLFLAWDVPASVGGLDDLESYIVHLDSFELDTTTALSYRTRIPSGEAGHAYWLTALYEGGESDATDTIYVTLLDADDAPTIPTVYAMAPAYPNPFNPTTTLQVSLPQSAELSLRVFDVTGREVATVAQGLYQAGNHSFSWNAAGLATGVYFARLESALGTQMQKLLLLK